MNKALIERTLTAMERGYMHQEHAEYCSIMEALKAELEKPGLEPVAWMSRPDEILPTFHRTKEAAAYWGDNPIPLYTKGTP